MAGAASMRESTVLVQIALDGAKVDLDQWEELRLLALSSGAEVEAEIGGNRAKPDPAYFVGKGKAEEIAALVQEHELKLAIFNHHLSPVQERNLEKVLQCRVLDRVGLILDIFARRAHTHEGKLQVELAQLDHLRTRLVRGWTHLERQRGGIGLRGPGETQLELDRRMIGVRMKSLRAALDKVRTGRELRRRARKRAPIPTVSLVGYTNAGKSTLFNTLTHAAVLAEDQLFATLDPTMRRLPVPRFGPVILADTVGFVRDLPHALVAAFRATLEEVRDAELLLHVVDVSNPDRMEQMRQVDGVLAEIEANEIPTLVVYNKIDRLQAEPEIVHGEDGLAKAVWLSARTGEGMELLLEAIASKFSINILRMHFTLGPGDGRWRAMLHERGHVLGENQLADGSVEIDVELEKVAYGRLRRQGLPGPEEELVAADEEW